MNWNLFVNELNEQLNNSKLTGRMLSEKIGRHYTYISQILNGKVKKVNYETSKKIFEVLDQIDPEYMNTYLMGIGIEVPTKLIDMEQLASTELHQCYKNYNWEEEYKTARERMISDFQELTRSEDEISHHAENKKTELSKGLLEVHKVLNLFLEKTFSVSNYSNKHRAEPILTTLIELITRREYFPIFEKLYKIPLHKLKPEALEKVIECITNECKYEYHFISGDNVDNEDELSFFEPLENYPHYEIRINPEQALKDWEALGQENNEDSDK